MSEAGKQVLLLQATKSSPQEPLSSEIWPNPHRESAKLAEEIPMEDGLVHTENSLISSGEMVLMQTARAAIQNPANGHRHNTRLLLDSGSQRTQNLWQTG